MGKILSVVIRSVVYASTLTLKTNAFCVFENYLVRQMNRETHEQVEQMNHEKGEQWDK